MQKYFILSLDENGVLGMSFTNRGALVFFCIKIDCLPSIIYSSLSDGPRPGMPSVARPRATGS